MTTDSRYSPGLRRLHWLMAILIVLAYVAMEQRGIFPRGSSGRFAMVQSHFWIGISVFALVWLRLAQRIRHGAPPVTPALPASQALVSKVMHLALYAFFIVMPLLGLGTVWADGKTLYLPFTDIALPALLTLDKSWGHTFEHYHHEIAEVFYWVIGLHVLAAAYHHWVKRDDTLKRML